MEKGKTDKNRIKVSTAGLYAVVGFLFAFFAVTEKSLDGSGNIEWNAKYVLVLILLCIAGASVFFGLYYFSLRLLPLFSRKETSKSEKKISTKTAFLGAFLLNMLAYLPYYLAYFPGIMAYDFPIQAEQFFTGAYNTHHPLFHTLLIEGCVKIGEFMFSSQNAGVAIYTFLQMSFLALAFAYIMLTFCKLKVSFGGKLIFQLFSMFYIFNGYMSVSITKDVIFTGFLIIFISNLVLILYGFSDKAYHALMMVGIIGVCLYRNNGLYALIVVIAFEAIYSLITKRNVRLLLETVMGLVVSLALLKGISFATCATEGDKREMLSVPIQQLARTYIYHEDELTEEEKSLINDFILYEGYRDYNPVISDPCKKKTNTSVVRYDTGRFIKTYFSLFRKYPGDYLDAFLALIGGYVSPFDESFREMSVNGETITRNYIQYASTYEPGAYGDDIHENSLLPKIKEVMDSYALKDGFYTPVKRIIYIPGLLLWIYLCIFVNAVDKRDVKRIIPICFVAGFYITLFLGPTMHLRYLYPLIAELPLFLIRNRKKNET